MGVAEGQRVAYVLRCQFAILEGNDDGHVGMKVQQDLSAASAGRDDAAVTVTVTDCDCDCDDRDARGSEAPELR